MNPNHKLTNTIKGRAIQAVQQNETELLIEFEDGSKMHVKTAEPTASVMVRNSQNGIEYTD